MSESSKAIALRYIDDHMARERAYRDLVAALPDNLPVYHMAVDANWVCLYIPASWTRFRELRRALGPDFVRNPQERHAYEYQDGEAIGVELIHAPTKLRVSIYMSLGNQGATCRRVKVGEVTRDVYKIVCDAQEVSNG